MCNLAITRVMSVKNEDRRISPENPLRGKVLYRRIAESEPVQGEGISFSGSGIQFSGPRSLTQGEAAEVRIDAVKGLSPPLTAYIEVTRCEPDDAKGYRIDGLVKGIRSH